MSRGARLAHDLVRSYPMPEPTRSSRHYDRPQHLSALHSMKCLLNVAEGDRLGDKSIEVESPLKIEIDQHWKVPRRQTIPIPTGLQLSTSPEEVDHRQVDAHIGRGDTDLYQGAS